MRVNIIVALQQAKQDKESIVDFLQESSLAKCYQNHVTQCTKRRKEIGENGNEISRQSFSQCDV